MPSKKPLEVSGFYDGIFIYYDKINTILTFGMDRVWRKATAEEALVRRPGRILDVCCGTGAMTAMLKSSGARIVTGLDFNENMLSIAKRRVGGTEFICARADKLPFEDASFDAITMAFAARNLLEESGSLRKYFSELRRVLKPGGRFINLETSQPSNRLIRFFFHLKAHAGVFLAGLVLPRSRAAYRFLGNSISTFYGPDEFSAELTASGFKETRYKRMLFGAIAIHTAINNISPTRTDTDI